MKRRKTRTPAWAKAVERGFMAITRSAMASGTRALGRVLEPAVARRTPPPGGSSWLPGIAMGTSGALRFRLYRLRV